MAGCGGPAPTRMSIINSAAGAAGDSIRRKPLDDRGLAARLRDTKSGRRLSVLSTTRRVDMSGPISWMRGAVTCLPCHLVSKTTAASVVVVALVLLLEATGGTSETACGGNGSTFAG